MDQKIERNVVLGEVDNTVAGKALRDAPDISNVSDAVIRYSVNDNYTTFSAKYGVRGTDLIVAFYPTPEFRLWAEDPDAWEALDARCREAWSDPAVSALWSQKFPETLSMIAQNHFEATYPRLQAKYTEELKSWWLLAQGFGYLLGLDRFVEMFLQRLDEALDTQ